MTTVTKASVLRLGRIKWGPGVELRHTPSAPDVSEKARILELRRAMRIRKEALVNEKTRLYNVGDPYKGLLEASRFAVDVEGGEPSISALRRALERAEKYEAVREEILQIEEQLRNPSRLHHYRWALVRIMKVDGIGFANKVCEQADSLEELMEKIEKR